MAHHFTTFYLRAAYPITRTRLEVGRAFIGCHEYLHHCCSPLTHTSIKRRAGDTHREICARLRVMVVRWLVSLRLSRVSFTGSGTFSYFAM
eukprot:6370919-Amphidinium_carterae.3